MSILRRSNAGYDPVLGRWGAPDPLEQFHSPYLSNHNNPANFVDPDGRQDKFWQLVGVVEAFIVANVSVFGTVGGTGAEVANGSLNIAGTLGFGATVALKITSIWKGIQAWVADHHVSIVKSASTTTAGAGSNGTGGPGWTDNGSHLVSGSGTPHALPSNMLVQASHAQANPKC
jgi:hypothetical protein